MIEAALDRERGGGRGAETEVLIPKSRHQPSKDQASSFPPATNVCVIAIWTLNGGRSPTLLSSPPERRPDLGRR